MCTGTLGGGGGAGIGGGGRVIGGTWKRLRGSYPTDGAGPTPRAAGPVTGSSLATGGRICRCVGGGAGTAGAEGAFTLSCTCSGGSGVSSGKSEGGGA